MTLYVREMEIKEESMELGRKKGRQEGRIEGKQEGRHAMQYQIARSLLGMLNDQEIAKTTGLTVEQVNNLRMQQN